MRLSYQFLARMAILAVLFVGGMWVVSRVPAGTYEDTSTEVFEQRIVVQGKVSVTSKLPFVISQIGGNRVAVGISQSGMKPGPFQASISDGVWYVEYGNPTLVVPSGSEVRKVGFNGVLGGFAFLALGLGLLVVNEILIGLMKRYWPEK